MKSCCINCQRSERIEGRNEMIGCKNDHTVHNCEDVCDMWDSIDPHYNDRLDAIAAAWMEHNNQ